MTVHELIQALEGITDHTLPIQVNNKPLILIAEQAEPVIYQGRQYDACVSLYSRTEKDGQEE
jgi:hypothetical protein